MGGAKRAAARRSPTRAARASWAGARASPAPGQGIAAVALHELAALGQAGRHDRQGVEREPRDRGGELGERHERVLGTFPGAAREQPRQRS